MFPPHTGNPYHRIGSALHPSSRYAAHPLPDGFHRQHQ